MKRERKANRRVEAVERSFVATLEIERPVVLLAHFCFWIDWKRLRLEFRVLSGTNQKRHLPHCGHRTPQHLTDSPQKKQQSPYRSLQPQGRQSNYDKVRLEHIPMIVDMLSDQIHTTRCTDIEIRLAVILFLKQIVQLRKTFSDFWNVVIHLLKADSSTRVMESSYL